MFYNRTYQSEKSSGRNINKFMRKSVLITFAGFTLRNYLVQIHDIQPGNSFIKT
jgi:hypothetical protein